MEKKITKKAIYSALVVFAQTGEMPEEITQDILEAFATKEIELLDKKSAKARETSAKKKAENDELTKIVASVLTDEFEPIADIAARVEVEDATVSKITYRLTKLVESGVAEKTDMKIETDGKKRNVKGYRLATEEAVETEE